MGACLVGSPDCQVVERFLEHNLPPLLERGHVLGRGWSQREDGSRVLVGVRRYKSATMRARCRLREHLR